MKTLIHSSMVVMAVALLALTGCAKEEVVKKDEPVVQQQTVKQQAPQQQAVTTPQSVAKPSDQTDTGSAAKASAAVSLETVYFDFDRSDLSKASRDALSNNAQTLLKNLVNAKVKIEGNCDERGSDEYNLALGERRAKSAAAYLITMGLKQTESLPSVTAKKSQLYREIMRLPGPKTVAMSSSSSSRYSLVKFSFLVPPSGFRRGTDLKRSASPQMAKNRHKPWRKSARQPLW